MKQSKAISFDLIDIREYFVHESETYIKIRETLAKEISTDKIFEFDLDTKVIPVEDNPVLKAELREMERIREAEMSISGKSVFTMDEQSKRRSEEIEKARREKEKLTNANGQDED